MNNSNIAQESLIEQTLEQIEYWYANDYLASMAEFNYCPMCDDIHQNNTTCQRSD